jgi:hypothetical protein
VLPNMRMKLPWRGGRTKGKGSVLIAAPHHAAYARFVRRRLTTPVHRHTCTNNNYCGCRLFENGSLGSRGELQLSSGAGRSSRSTNICAAA